MEELGTGPVCIDAAVFIYFIERHPLYGPVVKPLFRAIDQGKVEAVTSALSLLEVLVVPYRRNDVPLAERYDALLTRSRGLRMIELTRSMLRSAAQLRAVTKIKTPDALQLAAALSEGCTDFVTNDRDLPSLSTLKVHQLGAYAPAGPR